MQRVAPMGSAFKDIIDPGLGDIAGGSLGRFARWSEPGVVDNQTADFQWFAFEVGHRCFRNAR